MLDDPTHEALLAAIRFDRPVQRGRLSALLWGCAPDALHALADRHKVGPRVAFAVLETDGPLDHREAAAERLGAMDALHRARQDRLLGAEVALRRAGVRALWLRGPVLGVLAFGEPRRRHPSRDLDVLVDAADATRARAIAGEDVDVAAIDAVDGLSGGTFEAIWARARGVAALGGVSTLSDADQLAVVRARAYAKAQWGRWVDLAAFAAASGQVGALSSDERALCGGWLGLGGVASWDDAASRRADRRASELSGRPPWRTRWRRALGLAG